MRSPYPSWTIPFTGGKTMKKTTVLLLIILVLYSFISCRMNDPSPKPPTLVTIGDSITMGIQDAGLHEDFQHHAYGYLIAKQMGDPNYFQQPYVSDPGIGVPPYKYPFELVDGSISAEYWDESTLSDPEAFQNEIFPLLSNIGLLAPYNNLGINGARLEDIDAGSAAESAGGNNFFFDIVLRTQFLPFLEGTNAISQAARLAPDYLIFWIGNNDILHVVLDGAGIDGSGFVDNPGDPENDLPTTTNDFNTLFEARLLELLAITPNIIVVSIPSYLPYVSALDGIVQGDPAVPCVFDPTSFEPIDFDDDPVGELYIPLLLEEEGAAHVLLSGAIEYLHLEDPDGAGLGIPDATDLISDPYNYTSGEADALVTAMQSFGLTPSGEPLGGEYTLTAAEETEAQGFITNYNASIQILCTTNNVPLLDISDDWWDDDGAPDGEGYSGLHALQAEGTTTFSLDGVHPNNLGHALIARALIDVLNDEYALGISQIDPADYAGQYEGKNITIESLKALRRVKEF